jgi:hypothetical protein
MNVVCRIGRMGPLFFVLIALGFAGCSGRVLDRAPSEKNSADGGVTNSADGGVTNSADGGVTNSADGGTRDASVRVTPPARAEAGAPAISPDAPAPRGETAPAPNPACPEVFSGGVPNRSGSGADGLAVLRARVLTSREAFQRYTAVHHDTYRYTRWRETRSGNACSTTVQVTTGAVSSVTVSRLDPGTSRWSTRTYSPDDPSAASCFEPVTMYDLYDECLTHVLCQDPRTNAVDVQVDARGVLVQCGYSPDGCTDDCFTGLGAVVLTTDGKDWTVPLPGCCPLSSVPGCCMEYGGPVPNCGTTCDGMPNASEPGWHIAISREGCAEWVEPPEGSYTACCGCATVDASVVIDSGP